MGNAGDDEETTGSDFAKEFEVEASPGPEGCYINAQPMWSFNNWGIIPGALLMPQCVSAALKTIPPDFHVHSMQTHFLRTGTVTKLVTYRVEYLNDGKTFATRRVEALQDGKTIASATVGFTGRAVVAGRATTTWEHAAPAVMHIEAPSEECDEIRYIRADSNPTIKGYTMPIISLATSPGRSSKLARHWLRASAPIAATSSNKTVLLGLIALSDIFFLDSGPRIYGLGFDLATERSLRESLARDLKAMTTINHSIYIANADAVRLDEWVYVECEVPWASNGRVMVHSRIFSREGILLATCAQEGLLLFREGATQRIALEKL